MRCQKAAAADHDSICDDMVETNAMIHADIRQTTKIADAHAKSLIDDLDKEEKKLKAATKTKAKVQESKQEEPEQEEYYTKPFSTQQAREARIYSILASKIDKYRNFCQELPGKEGLRLVKLAQHQPQGPEQIENSYIKLVELLREIHAAGVVCSDLKPEHIMTRKDGELFVIDFNCSHYADADMSEVGLSLSWGSLDQLINKECDILDDLEAACRIAKYWAAPFIKVSEHQREGVIAGVTRLVALLSPTPDWLDGHLRYVVSRSRKSEDTTIYDKLICGKKFKFSVEDFEKDFEERRSKLTISVRPSGGAGNLGNVKGSLVEEVVRANMQEMFPGQKIEINNFYFRQTFHDEKTNLDATEWDFVLARQQGYLPQPVSRLGQPFPKINGGMHLVGEVWANSKPASDLRKKFKALFEGHRPIHTLYYIAEFLMVAGDCLIYQDDRLAMEAPTLLVYALGEDPDFCVLLAAGRCSFFSLGEFPIGKTFEISARTICGLQRRVEELEKKLVDQAAAHRKELATQAADFATQFAALDAGWSRRFDELAQKVNSLNSTN